MTMLPPRFCSLKMRAQCLAGMNVPITLFSQNRTQLIRTAGDLLDLHHLPEPINRVFQRRSHLLNTRASDQSTQLLVPLCALSRDLLQHCFCALLVCNIALDIGCLQSASCGLFLQSAPFGFARGKVKIETDDVAACFEHGSGEDNPNATTTAGYNGCSVAKGEEVGGAGETGGCLVCFGDGARGGMIEAE